MKALIVVDMQNDFITGCLANSNAEKIIPNINQKILNMGKDDIIIFTKDSHNGAYNELEESKFVKEHCQYGTWGEAIDDRILYKNCVSHRVIMRKDIFATTNICYCLENYSIKDIESIELCGIVASICVVSNALMLKSFFPQIPIYVSKKCIADLNDESFKSAINIMKNCCINILE